MTAGDGGGLSRALLLRESAGGIVELSNASMQIVLWCLLVCDADSHFNLLGFYNLLGSYNHKQIHSNCDGSGVVCPKYGFLSSLAMGK